MKFNSDQLAKSILFGHEAYVITQAIKLPPMLVAETDQTAFRMLKNEPNHITLKSCAGAVESEEASSDLFEDNILIIQSADPGYDWVFSHNIGGLNHVRRSQFSYAY